MEKQIITVKKYGNNEFFAVRKQLDDFVNENFKLLWQGAVRLGNEIDEDCYTCKRIQINNTRLHAQQGLKYCSGHKYSYDLAPTEEQLKNTIKDIQTLIDEASKEIKCSFILKIEEK